MTSLRALLAENIKKRRKDLEISQSVLAEKVGTSTHYIGQIERCKKFPSSEMLERIAAALEMDSPELFATRAFKDEDIKKAQENVKAELGTIALAICKNLNSLKGI